MRRAIAIIGANEFQNRLILRAKDLGFETHVFAWLNGAVGKQTADYFYPISITEKEKILEQCRQIHPIAVTSIASDLAVSTVTYVASELGLPCNTFECATVSTNKYLMRRRFQQMGIISPEFAKISSVKECESLNLTFPLIVKPTDRSGSRGVTKVSTLEELKKAAKICIDVSFKKEAIVEEFIEGEEFSAEYISFKGCHHLLAVTKKITTGSPNFIEKGHVQPADIPKEVLNNARVEIEKGLDALGIQNGASHPEFKIAPDGSTHLIEIGARMGGDCIGSDLVQISTGMDFLKMTIDVACGLQPDFTNIQEPCCAAVSFVFGQPDIERLEQIKKKEPELLYRVSIEEPISSRTVTDSSTRFGYYILAGRDKAQLLKLIQSGNGKAE